MMIQKRRNLPYAHPLPLLGFAGVVLGSSFSPHPAQTHPTAELGLSCTQKRTPAIAALFFI